MAELNAKIALLPKLDQVEFHYLRDERLGILGVKAGVEPTEEQVKIVHNQLFT